VPKYNITGHSKIQEIYLGRSTNDFVLQYPEKDIQIKSVLNGVVNRITATSYQYAKCPVSSRTQIFQLLQWFILNSKQKI